MHTQIVKWGNSQGVRIPKAFLGLLNISADDVVDITTENNSLVIRKIESKPKRKTIQERFEGFTGEYEPIEIDWGESEGKELW